MGVLFFLWDPYGSYDCRFLMVSSYSSNSKIFSTGVLKIFAIFRATVIFGDVFPISM